MKRRCMSCNGSGRVMGGGMMMHDCDNCEGRGKIEVVDDDMTFLSEQENLRLKEAQVAVKKAHPELDSATIEKLVANASIEVKNKRGRKSKVA